MLVVQIYLRSPSDSNSGFAFFKRFTLPTNTLQWHCFSRVATAHFFCFYTAKTYQYPSLMLITFCGKNVDILHQACLNGFYDKKIVI